ncbi:NUDIX hydrolase [Cupriavidus sp. CV2]|uniref:NUDIX hydrolase n=1 Tax=Cupriavidus ulmosensis TaxID=3065913 RepID=UPI00296B083A|nr:NUDIX hydrolase [Cupriavidus sp. CV2]MDW3681609.1 NUDIX hydrolase [Cupriavidus sp. CV2]
MTNMSHQTWVLHPRPDEHGKPFKIHEPSTPTGPETWMDPVSIALWTPDSAVPVELNGVPFSPWTDHPVTDGGWNYVDGLMDDLDEPPLVTNGKNPAAGVVVVEPDGRVWIVCPSNGFAGYRATFPKGHADEGLSLQAAAIREAFEESGLKVAIMGFIDDVERTQTMTRYYRARRVGGTPAAMGWETQGVALVPAAEVAGYVNRDVDRTVASKAGLGTHLVN